MFEKMIKLRNRKAFTLVEMLVVIAIIAILVAIIVPIIGTSTTKSRAATNAANLRSIEGKLSTLRVEYPEAFGDALDKATTSLQGALGDNYDLVNDLMGVFGYESITEFIESGHSLAELATYSLCHTRAVNGVLTISGGTGEDIVIENVPTAKGIDIENMKVEEGTEMTVYITEGGLMATYEDYNFSVMEGSSGNSYTRMDFAEVAETGKFTGTSGSGGTSFGDVVADVEDFAVQTAKCAAGQHTVPADSCICSSCGKVVHHAETTHYCTLCEDLVHSEHVRDGLSENCKYCDATVDACDCYILKRFMEVTDDDKCKFCGCLFTEHELKNGLYYSCTNDVWNKEVPTKP